MATQTQLIGPLTSQLSLLARHSAWATARLISAANKLPLSELDQDIGLPFRSVRATFNHLVCADIVWLRRFLPEAQLPLEVNSSLWEPPTNAGQWSDVAGLPDFKTAAMEFEKLAERWIALVGSTSEEALAEKFEYTHRSGAVRKKVRSEMLLHVFNHHTHHRGQISAGLSILATKSGLTDFKVPSMDLLYYVEEETAKLAAISDSSS